MQITRSGRAAPMINVGSRHDGLRSVVLTAGALVSLFLVGPAESQTATPVAATVPLQRAALPAMPPKAPVALPADCQARYFLQSKAPAPFAIPAEL